MFCTKTFFFSKEPGGGVGLWDPLHLHLLAHALLAHQSLGGVSVHPGHHVRSHISHHVVVVHHVGGHVPAQHVRGHLLPHEARVLVDVVDVATAHHSLPHHVPVHHVAVHHGPVHVAAHHITVHHVPVHHGPVHHVTVHHGPATIPLDVFFCSGNAS